MKSQNNCICKNCKHVFLVDSTNDCPHCSKCGANGDNIFSFKNSDNYLKEMVPKVIAERKKYELEGIVKGLAALIINTEENNHKSAIKELVGDTGYKYAYTFKDTSFLTSVLELNDSADLLIQSRIDGNNPFKPYNSGAKAVNYENTRIETFVFNIDNIHTYVQTQKKRNLTFLTPKILETDLYHFIQSPPSKYIGISYGYIQWKNVVENSHRWNSKNGVILDWNFNKPEHPHLKKIKKLDHTATRVRARDRDQAIIEFMNYTNYKFDFAVYVKSLNSITNVARLSADDFAMVFTSGISTFKSLEESGPTEGFIHNYGTRTHHMAFVTDEIQETYIKLKENGNDFLSKLIGSREEGLRQIFSAQSKYTLLVNEYIQRYDGFDGFFTKNNVANLTKATEKQ